MDLNALSPTKGANKKSYRVGRGDKTCGRGHKGQKSRSGGGPRNGFEGGQNPIYCSLPKHKHVNSKWASHTTSLPLSALNCFEPQEMIDMKSLLEKKLIGADCKRVRVYLSGKVSCAYRLSGVHLTQGVDKFLADLQKTKNPE